MIHDYVIIGAGTAGLPFASNKFRSNPKAKILILDQGVKLEDRNRDDPISCLIGTGGAGLYSDGKFSFYPAGTAIWKLDNTNQQLEKAYNLLAGELKQFNLPIPEFNTHEFIDHTESTWSLKEYPSYYLNIQQRKQLIHNLIKHIPEDCILYETKVISWIKINDIYHITANVKNHDIIILAKNIICAGGRFQPLSIKNYVQTIFRRYEFGVRIVGHYTISSLIKPNGLLDPKYKCFSDNTKSVEYRTFCWCSQGEYVLTNFDDICTYSGRADCEKTLVTNFGFNVRVLDNELISDDEFKKYMMSAPFKMSVKDLLNDKLDGNIGRIIKNGLQMLSSNDQFKSLLECDIVGPTIEGVGYYPDIDHTTLKVRDENIYCIGDCSGIFRGIVPGMLSGYWLSLHKNID